MSSKRIMIMAGGTGGHVFPALAVAHELKSRGVEVSWLGTRRGIESELIPAAGFPIDYITISGLRGKGLGGWLLAPLRLFVALVQALAVLRRRKPGAVLGMGGFVTGPGGIATKLTGRALLIHEQNAIAGLTNRLLSPLADQVLEGFPDTFSGRHVQYTGNPVRKDIMQIAAPGERYAKHDGPIRLFVFGGSLGAMVFNQIVPGALAQLPENIRPVVRHQTGKKKLETTRENYTAAGVEAETMAFVDDMAAMYEWADVVLCRAGALTVSELAMAGVPALLVPYPYAVDDHQSANARYLADNDAARLIPQTAMDEQSLSALLREFCEAPEEGREVLREMANHARAMAKPEATETVVEACLSLAKEEKTA